MAQGLTLTICREAVDIVKKYEGFSARPYLCPAGYPTIGWGSIWAPDGGRVTLSHRPITEDEAEKLLHRELVQAGGAVRRLIKVPLDAYEFGALVSFTYNVGSGALQRSTLRAKLNRGDRQGAADEFPKWRKAGGKVLKGLVRRRAEERSLFLARSNVVMLPAHKPSPPTGEESWTSALLRGIRIGQRAAA